MLHSCLVFDGIEVLAFAPCIAHGLKRSITLTGDMVAVVM